MNTVKNEYERLLELDNTPRQEEFIRALLVHDTVAEAGHSIGIKERSAFKILARIREKQNAIGEGSHFIGTTNLRDTGLHVKGTSTLYKDGEPSIQWVKTDRNTGRQRQCRSFS